MSFILASSFGTAQLSSPRRDIDGVKNDPPPATFERGSSIVIKCKVKGDLLRWDPEAFSRALLGRDGFNCDGRVEVVDTQRSAISKVKMQVTLLFHPGFDVSNRTLTSVLQSQAFDGFHIAVDDIAVSEAPFC